MTFGASGAQRRVLWLHQNLVTGFQAGNGRAGYSVAALLEAGWSVDLVAADHTYLGEPIDEPPVQREGALSVYRVPIVTRGKGLAYGSFAARALAVARSLPRPDLIFLSSPPLPGAVPALAWARGMGIPVLAEIRDLWPAFLLEGGLLSPGPGAAALQGLELAVLAGAARVLSVSPGFSPYLAGLGHPPRVAVTGCDPGFGGPRAARGGRPQIAYTGSLNEAYGIELLLELAGSRPDLDWVIAGAGRGRAQVQAAAQSLPHLRYLGPLPRRDIPGLLAGSTVAVNLHARWPLLGTTLTGKLFDYLSCGVAVLDLAGGQMARLLQRAGAGETAPRDVAAAGAALDRVLADAEPMGARGRAFGLAHLDAWSEARVVAEEAALAAGGEPPSVRGMLGALRGRAPKRVLADVYGSDPGAVAADAFDAWLESRPKRELRPLRLPQLLGGQPLSVAATEPASAAG